MGYRPRQHARKYGAVIVHGDGRSWTSRQVALSRFSELNAVEAPTADDGWAVGATAPTTAEIPLIEHWDGTAWAPAETSRQPSAGALQGVHEVSRNDVWAVGEANRRALIEHWRGETWARVQNPVAGRLSAVDGSSANDLWAVGYVGDGQVYKPIVEQWNGVRWRLKAVPNPAPGGQTLLTSVVAPSATNVWAFGFDTPTTSGATSQPLIEHWNGVAWRIQRTPLIEGTDVTLDGASSTSARDIWVAGSYADQEGVVRGLVLHWNGSTWSVSFEGPSGSRLTAISAASPTDVWAVTTTPTYLSAGMEHWNGSGWSRS